MTMPGQGKMPEHHAATALYPRLIGKAWAELDASVQHWHDASHQVQGTGLFTVRHGQRGMARFLVWLLRLPTSGEALATRLVILRHAWGETWSRTLAGRALMTIQYQRGTDLLCHRARTGLLAHGHCLRPGTHTCASTPLAGPAHCSAGMGWIGGRLPTGGSVYQLTMHRTAAGL